MGSAVRIIKVKKKRKLLHMRTHAVLRFSSTSRWHPVDAGKMTLPQTPYNGVRAGKWLTDSVKGFTYTTECSVQV